MCRFADSVWLQLSFVMFFQRWWKLQLFALVSAHQFSKNGAFCPLFKPDAEQSNECRTSLTPGRWRFRPAHTCISEPLDKPRALASSGLRPFFSVLLTENQKGNTRYVAKICSALTCQPVLRDLRLTRDRLLSRGCVRWLGPWVADLTILSMISSAVSSAPFTRSSPAGHQGATRTKPTKSASL